MQQKKELIESEREDALARVNAKLELDKTKINNKISRAESKYAEQTDDTEIAYQLMQKFNYSAYKGILESMGIDFTDGITRGLQGILSAFEKRFPTSSSSSSYDYSQNSKTYNMYASFSGVKSENDITRNLRKLLEQLELEARI